MKSSLYYGKYQCRRCEGGFRPTDTDSLSKMDRRKNEILEMLGSQDYRDVKTVIRKSENGHFIYFYYKTLNCV